MNLNLFDRKNDNSNGNFIKEFIEELKNALGNTTNDIHNVNEESKVMEEYNRYERRKVFLDNKSWNGNDFAWVMDEGSVCISENGDGGPYAISDINLPKNAKVGDVYEKIDGKYVYNEKITEELNKIDSNK